MPLGYNDFDYVCLKGDSPIRTGEPFFIPEFSSNISARLAFSVKTMKVGKYISKKFAHRYYDQYTLGIDFTAEDILSKLKDSANPWALAKSFEGSCAFGKWLSIDSFNYASLRLNDNEVSSISNIDKKYFEIIDQAIEMLSRFYTIKIGDIIMLTLGRNDIDQLHINDNISLELDGVQLLSMNIV